jgi:signal transduction histidine kinase
MKAAAKTILLFSLLRSFTAGAQQNRADLLRIDSLEKVLQTQKEDTAKLHTLFALVHEFKYSNSDTALYFENTALALATKLNYQIGIARAKRGLSAICADQGKYSEGVKYGNDALNLYTELLSSATVANKEIILKGIALTHTLIGHNTFSQGNYPEALKHTFIALNMSEKLGDKSGISLNEFNIGNIYLGQHNYTTALKYFHSALTIAEQLEDKGSSGYITACIGLLYFEQGNYGEAKKSYSTALKIAKEINDIHTLQEAYNSLGLLADKQGNYDEALEYDFAALKLYDETGFNEQIPLIYNNVALVYMKEKRYDDASKYLQKALAYAKEIRSLLYIKLSYENLAVLDSACGNYKKALEHYKLAITYRDSMFNEENTKKTVQQQMQYEFDKKQDSIKTAQDKKDVLALAEIKNQKLVRNFSITGAFAIISFGGYSFYRYRRRRKLQSQQEMLNERLRISRELHDDIGSTLGSISIYSEVAKTRSLRNENSDEAISKIGVASRELIEKISDIVWSINPNNESFEQLENRMQAFAAMILTPRGIRYHFNADEEIKKITLTAEERKNIFLIFKEAIHNIVKYAECSNVEIKLSIQNHQLEMSIRDDGKGFGVSYQNPETHASTLGGNGLKNMHVRAGDINAELLIQSEINEGTTVHLKFNT